MLAKLINADIDTFTVDGRFLEGRVTLERLGRAWSEVQVERTRS